MPERSAIYTLDTVAAASPRLAINEGGPHVLLNDAREQQNLLGHLPREDGELPWACILPLQQPQGKNESVACAGMNTPQTSEWRTLDELGHDELGPNMRFLLQHLEAPGAAMGFNYSPDPRTRTVAGKETHKFKPNSWDHFHMHWMTGLVAAAQEISVQDTVTLSGPNWTREVRPRRFLRELFPHVIDRVLEEAYQDDAGIGQFVMSPELRRTLPFAPDGGVVLALPAAGYGNVQALGVAIKTAHEIYGDTHRKVWDVFVSNYGAVAESGWAQEYIPRDEGDITTRLAKFTNSRLLQRGMARYVAALRSPEEVADPMKWLYKGPSHSMAIYKHGTDYILSLLPHLMHPTNWLAAMGIFEVRQTGATTLEAYRAHATAHAGRLGATALAT